MKPQVISEQPMSMSDARKELKRIKKRDGELSFRSAKTEEYLGEMTLLGEKAAKDLTQAIVDLGIPRLKDDHIAKIVDMLPHNKEDLKMLLSSSTLTIKDDNVAKILEIVTQYRK